MNDVDPIYIFISVIKEFFQYSWFSKPQILIIMENLKLRPVSTTCWILLTEVHTSVNDAHSTFKKTVYGRVCGSPINTPFTFILILLQAAVKVQLPGPSQRAAELRFSRHVNNIVKLEAVPGEGSNDLALRRGVAGESGERGWGEEAHSLSEGCVL